MGKSWRSVCTYTVWSGATLSTDKFMIHVILKTRQCSLWSDWSEVSLYTYNSINNVLQQSGQYNSRSEFSNARDDLKLRCLHMTVYPISLRHVTESWRVHQEESESVTTIYGCLTRNRLINSWWKKKVWIHAWIFFVSSFLLL